MTMYSMFMRFTDCGHDTSVRIRDSRTLETLVVYGNYLQAIGDAPDDVIEADVKNWQVRFKGNNEIELVMDI